MSEDYRATAFLWCLQQNCFIERKST